MSDPVVFVDCETTGLDPERHEVFEIALVSPEFDQTVFLFRPNLAIADPGALRINRYYERFPDGIPLDVPREAKAASEIARLTSGKHLVGNVPSFDAAFIAAFLKRHGLVPAWHYHLVDVEALVAGKLGLRPPWNSADLSKAINVEPPATEHAHTALEDARWAKRLYEAVFAS